MRKRLTSIVGETVRRERRRTSAYGSTPEVPGLVDSSAAPIVIQSSDLIPLPS